MGFTIGDRVVDDEQDDDGDTAIVVDVLDTRASEYALDESEKTIADVNSGYSQDARVIEVLFEPTLDKVVPDWQLLTPSGLQAAVENRGIQPYAYPKPRLTRQSNALVDSVTVWFAGAADPITQDEGAYGFVVQQDDEVVCTRSGPITDRQTVTTGTAAYIALKNALDWVIEQDASLGLRAFGDDESVVRQIQGRYTVQSAQHEDIHETVTERLNELPAVRVQEIPRQENNRAVDAACEAYEEMTSEDKTMEAQSEAQDGVSSTASLTVEPLVGDQYLVENQFTVDAAQGTCTCDMSTESDEPCDHVKAVRD